jgi:hypothetical protein
MDTVEAVWNLITDLAVNTCRVTVPFAMIADRIGLTLDEVDDAVADLGEVGLVSAWDPGGGPSATLTPLAARRLGLKLRRFEGRDGNEFMPVGRPDPLERQRRRKTIAASTLGIDLDRLPGDAPRPDMIVEAAEAIEALAPRRAGRESDDAARQLPRPPVMLEGCRPWPEGWPGHPGYDGRCPACRGSKLSAAVYCLVCDRWGLDWRVNRLLQADRLADALASAKQSEGSDRTLAERRAGVA